MNYYPSTQELNEVYARPDTVSMCLDPYAEAKVIAIVDFDEARKFQGDFGKVTDLYMTSIPIYPDAEVALDSAMRYVFNQIEIRDLQKQSIELLQKVGSGC